MIATSRVPALPLALTMGEPAGIGAEIALQSWLRRTAEQLPVFFLLDDPARLNALAHQLGWTVPLAIIDNPAAATAAFDHALPVLPVTLPNPVQPGTADPRNAAAVIAAIDQAVDFALHRKVAGIVTNPIHKAVLLQSGFPYPGHTEYLAERAGGGTAVMLLAVPELRVVPVTIHVPLRQAIADLTTEAIVQAGMIAAAALQADFGIANPRLAVSGLNPHAGEDGMMGREDLDIITPAIARLRAAGIAASGPHAADTMFHAAARARYDVAICMYHDQALIPLKTLDFDRGVNVTLGLSIVRTSPDHGTAFDIAGTGKARPDSLMAALRLATEIAGHRQHQVQMATPASLNRA